jgi:nucleolar protein 9
MLLELETALGQADAADSIMDRVLAGLITESSECCVLPYRMSTEHFACAKVTAVVSSPSSYVSALLLDTTSSHLSESILSRSSPRVFYRIWDCYFSSDLPKLAAHPVANFVVARGVERLDEGRLRDAVTQLHATWSKTLSEFLCS